ncbi:MAG: signal peptidase I [Lachnospiraceae bacterium]|nr:signal peptidase I [Lachnospiraceae bacterium]
MEFGFRDEKEGTFHKIIREWPILLIEIVVAIVLGFLLVTFGFEKTTVSGNSMDSILSDGDVIIASKVAYFGFKPKRNDVVVFRQEGKEHSYNSVKRIIGLPGEKIQIIDGKVYIDGNPYKEVNKVEPMISGGIAEDEITLGEGEYFVLGDNRNQSEDSRYSSVGMISRSEIIGKAWIRVKPSFGFVRWLGADKVEKKSINSDEKEEE